MNTILEGHLRREQVTDATGGEGALIRGKCHCLCRICQLSACTAGAAHVLSNNAMAGTNM